MTERRGAREMSALLFKLEEQIGPLDKWSGGPGCVNELAGGQEGQGWNRV